MSKAKPHKKKSHADIATRFSEPIEHHYKHTKDPKILKIIIDMLNIREQFKFMSMDSYLRNVICGSDLYKKYIKVRKEFIKDDENNNKKFILIESVPKKIKKIRSPGKYRINYILNRKIEPEKEEKIIDDENLQSEKINGKIDYDKIIIEDLISDNYEKIKKISQKYHLNEYEENSIFIGLIESKILKDEEKEIVNLQNKDTKEIKDNKTHRENKSHKDNKLHKEHNKDHKEHKDNKDNKEHLENKENHENNEIKENNNHIEREKMQKLVLSNKNINNGIAFIITPLLSLEENNILKIDLSGNKLQLKSITNITLLINLNSRTLQILNLSNNKIDDHCCKILFNTLKLCVNLTTLNLSSNKISCDGISYSKEFLSNNSSLQTLVLGRNVLGPDGIAYLTQYIINNHQMILRTLDISYNGIEINGVKIICEYIKVNSKLISLFIGGNYICDEGAKILAKTLIDNSQCKITYLFMENNNITKNGAKYITKVISYHPFLSSINLKSNNLTDEGVKTIFCSLNPESKVTTLNLSNNNITGISMKYINEYIVHNSFLRQLFFDYNQLDKSACMLIKDILSNEQSNLKIISLKHCKINENINLIFEGLEKNKKIQILNLSKNEIGNYPEQFERIISCLKNNNTLDELILDSNYLDDETLKMITNALKENKNLQSISLNENQFSKKTISELFTVINQNKLIKKCSLEKCGLPNDYLLSLKKILENKLELNYFDKEDEEKDKIIKDF